jgi:hypothetical protein
VGEKMTENKHHNHTGCDGQITVSTLLKNSIGFICGCCSSNSHIKIVITCTECDFKIENIITLYQGEGGYT